MCHTAPGMSRPEILVFAPAGKEIQLSFSLSLREWVTSPADVERVKEMRTPVITCGTANTLKLIFSSCVSEGIEELPFASRKDTVRL